MHHQLIRIFELALEDSAPAVVTVTYQMYILQYTLLMGFF